MSWLSQGVNAAKNSQFVNPMQTGKAIGSTWDRVTGKNAGKGASQALQSEQQKMYGQLSTQEQAMTDAETQNYKNMADPSLGIESEAKSRMTMAQAQDPNNPVAVAFRNFYNQQASGESNKGLADVGVMSALGAQAMQGQMGNGSPMSTGQMQALQAQTQNQSGQAFSNVQKRVQSLKDQGVAQGWLQTQNAYQNGQQALDRYGNLSQMQADVSTGHAQRQSALISGESGAYQQMLAQQAQAKAMGNQAMMQGLGGMVAPMSSLGGLLGSNAMSNAPATSVAQYAPYNQGQQVK